MASACVWRGLVCAAGAFFRQVIVTSQGAAAGELSLRALSLTALLRSLTAF